MKGKFKGKISVLVILAVSIGLGFLTYIVVKDQKAINTDVVAYLEAQGYDMETDIEMMEIVNIGEEESKLAVVITFVDEPDVDYLYTYKDDTDEIYEFDRIER